MGYSEKGFWEMSPRKLVALIKAQRDIEDARLSRLAYVIKTGELPPRQEEEPEDDEEDDGAYALHF